MSEVISVSKIYSHAIQQQRISRYHFLFADSDGNILDACYEYQFKVHDINRVFSVAF